MIYLQLFWEFLKIGMFTFGGAYGAIPLIQQCVLERRWMDESMFSNMIGISESTPGPIMVNAATYVGNTQGGILGAAVATFGVVLPSFVIILLVSTLFKKVMQNHAVQSILKGIKPCIIGMILSTGLYMALGAILGPVHQGSIDLIALGIMGVLSLTIVLCKRLFQKEISPILLIVIAALLGAFLY